jgi:hypothetical protein
MMVTDRLIYRPPRGVHRWWLPRAGRGADEFCNPSAWVVLPPFGCLAVLWRPGPLRNELDEPCEVCREDMPGDVHLWVDTCEECGGSWFLPRDRYNDLCPILTLKHGTANPSLAFHLKHNHHSGPGCRCVRDGRYTLAEVTAALDARTLEGAAKHR